MLFEFVFQQAPDDVRLHLSDMLGVDVVLQSQQPMLWIGMDGFQHEFVGFGSQIHRI
jgi:hypothetical protein